MEYRFGKFRLDAERLELKKDDGPTKLRNKPLFVLIYLVRHRERIISREELARGVWGARDWSNFNDEVISQAIAAARKALDDKDKRTIRTIHSEGYQFCAGVEEVYSPATSEDRVFIDHGGQWTRLLRAVIGSSSGGSLQMLEGEHGMGKTWMLEELADQAARHGRRVLVFSPSMSDTPAGLAAWARSVVAVLLDREREQLGELLRSNGAEAIAPLVPDLYETFDDLRPLGEGPLTPSSPGLDQQQAAAAYLSRLVGRFAKGQPVILIFDDLHEIDDSLCRLLLALARESRKLPISIVGACRVAALGPKHPVAALLMDLYGLGLERTRLSGFSVAEIEEYIGRRGGIVLPALARDLHERTGGNPLFVAEVVSHAIEAGILDQPEEVLRQLPVSLCDAVACQLQRLSPACRELLEWASIFGSEFGIEFLARSGEGQEAIAELLEEATRAQILTRSGTRIGQYRFRHRLVWEVLYESIGLLDRARRHKEALLILERHYGRRVNEHLTDLWAHAFKGFLAGTADRAIHYGLLATKAAMRGYAFDKVILQCRALLEIIERRSPRDDGIYCDVLIRLSSALAQLGDIEQAKKEFRLAAQIARDAGLPEQQARAALGYGMAEEPVGVPASSELIELLNAALQDVTDGPLRVRLLCRLAVGLAWSESREQAILLSREAVELAKALGDPAEMARALLTERETGWTYDNVRSRLALDNEIVGLARPISHRELLLVGLSARIADGMELSGLAPEVWTDIHAFEREAERLQRPRFLWQVKALRGTLAWCDGRLEDAERLLGEAEQYGRQSHQPLAGQVAALQMWRLRTEQGRLAELRPSVEETVVHYPGLRGWRCVLGHLYAELGLRAEAASLLAEISDKNWALLPQDRFRVSALTSAAELCAFVGDAARARQLYGFLYEHRDRYVVVAYQAAFLGSPSYYLGRLAATMSRWSEATRHFKRALEDNKQVKPMLARVLYEFAAMLYASGRRNARVRVLCRQALSLAEKLGIVPLKKKAEALLRKLDRKDAA
jgi:DNA-binding winged helix-turn-helix (wHTH) protein